MPDAHSILRPGLRRRVIAAGVACAGYLVLTCVSPAPNSWAGAPAHSAAPVSVGTSVPPTTATVAPLRGQLPTPPSTLPLVTKAQSAHVDPILAKVSLGGLAVALLIMAVQFWLTRPSRRGRRTL